MGLGVSSEGRYLTLNSLLFKAENAILESIGLGIAMTIGAQNYVTNQGQISPASCGRVFIFISKAKEVGIQPLSVRRVCAHGGVCV